MPSPGVQRRSPAAGHLLRGCYTHCVDPAKLDEYPAMGLGLLTRFERFNQTIGDIAGTGASALAARGETPRRTEIWS